MLCTSSSAWALHHRRWTDPPMPRAWDPVGEIIEKGARAICRMNSPSSMVASLARKMNRKKCKSRFSLCLYSILSRKSHAALCWSAETNNFLLRFWTNAQLLGMIVFARDLNRSLALVCRQVRSCEIQYESSVVYAFATVEIVQECHEVDREYSCWRRVLVDNPCCFLSLAWARGMWHHIKGDGYLLKPEEVEGD